MSRLASPESVAEVRGRHAGLLADVPDETVARLIDAHLVDLRRAVVAWSAAIRAALAAALAPRGYRHGLYRRP